MNYLLLGSEILLIVMGIALVPARSELRICRSRVTYKGRPELKPRAHSKYGKLSTRGAAWICEMTRDQIDRDARTKSIINDCAREVS